MKRGDREALGRGVGFLGDSKRFSNSKEWPGSLQSGSAVRYQVTRAKLRSSSQPSRGRLNDFLGDDAA